MLLAVGGIITAKAQDTLNVKQGEAVINTGVRSYTISPVSFIARNNVDGTVVIANENYSYKFFINGNVFKVNGLIAPCTTSSVNDTLNKYKWLPSGGSGGGGGSATATDVLQNVANTLLQKQIDTLSKISNNILLQLQAIKDSSNKYQTVLNNIKADTGNNRLQRLLDSTNTANAIARLQAKEATLLNLLAITNTVYTQLLNLNNRNLAKDSSVNQTNVLIAALNTRLDNITADISGNSLGIESGIIIKGKNDFTGLYQPLQIVRDGTVVGSNFDPLLMGGYDKDDNICRVLPIGSKGVKISAGEQLPVSVNNFPANITGYALESTASALSNKFTPQTIIADATPNGSLTRINTYPMFWNGVNWDRQRGTITNGTLVDVSKIGGSLPSFTTPQTFNLGTLNGAATDRTLASAPSSNQLVFGGAFIDPRQTRALTSADIIDLPPATKILLTPLTNTGYSTSTLQTNGNATLTNIQNNTAVVPTGSTSTSAATLTITTGGTAQVLFLTNANRKFWNIVNTSTTDALLFDINGTATATSVKLAPATATQSGGSYRGTETNTISILGATTGATFRAWQQ